MSSFRVQFPPHFHVEQDAILELLVDPPPPPKGHADYSSAAFRLYAVLCSFAHGRYGTTNEVWPGYETLKECTGFSKTTIQRATALLIRLKFIKTLRQGTRHPSITYILIRRPVIPEWANKKSEGVASAPPVASTPPGGSVHAPQGGSVRAAREVASTRPEERHNEELHSEEGSKRRTAGAGSIGTSSGVQEGEIDTTQVNGAGGAPDDDYGAINLNGMAPYSAERYGSFDAYMHQLKAHRKREAQPDR